MRGEYEKTIKIKAKPAKATIASSLMEGKKQSEVKRPKSLTPQRARQK